jgi:hypothetical protein
LENKLVNQNKRNRLKVKLIILLINLVKMIRQETETDPRPIFIYPKK